MRRLISLIVILAVLAGAWAGGWFWLADFSERNLSRALQEVAERGVEVDCPGRVISGFPFALKVACGETTVAERTTSTTARVAGLTGGASIFAPLTAAVAVDSPAHVDSPLLAGPAEMRWDSAEVDVGLGMNGPENVSFDSANFVAEFTDPSLADPVVTAAKAGGTLAPSTNGGTDGALTFTDLVATVNGTALPPLTGGVSGEISAPPQALLAGRDALRAPLSVRDIKVSLTSGEARIDASGEIAIDREGVADGSLIIVVAGAEGITSLIESLPDEQEQIGSLAAGALFMFGRPTTLDGREASEIVMEIERGVARIGMVEVELPRVPL